MQKILDNDADIQDLLKKVKMAQINKDRFHQINEKQTRHLQEIV